MTDQVATPSKIPIYHRGEVMAQAHVSPTRYEILNRYTWKLERLSSPIKTPITEENIHGLWAVVYLDCKVLGVASGLHSLVVHRDGDGLNCQDDNLYLKEIVDAKPTRLEKPIRAEKPLRPEKPTRTIRIQPVKIVKEVQPIIEETLSQAEKPLYGSPRAPDRQQVRSRAKSATSPYYGVSWKDKVNKWQAVALKSTTIGPYLYLGVFQEEQEAAFAINEVWRICGYQGLPNNVILDENSKIKITARVIDKLTKAGKLKESL
jgi:hypothetical protein